MCEVWKEIRGFVRYEASNTGKIRKKHDKVLLKQSEKKGRMFVFLLTNSGRKTTGEVGKLVLSAFVEYKSPKKYMANHLDGDLKNNNIRNLKWEKRSKRVGRIIYLKKPGENHEFRTIRNVAKFLGMSISNATMVKVEKKAKEEGWNFKTKIDPEAYLDEEKFGPSEDDKKRISSPEVKQQIRDEIDKFVDYCDTHYSTCNEIANKRLISEIDETDPVVIKFRQFLKKHNV